MTNSPQPPQSSGSGCLILFLVLSLIGNFLLFFTTIIGFGSGALVGISSSVPSDKVKKYDAFKQYYLAGDEDSKNRIVVVDLTGVISMSIEGRSRDSMVEDFQAKIEQALDEKMNKSVKTKAIIVRINSPGGEVYASDLLYKSIKNASGEVPVLAYMESIAASGGYYSAIGATEIMAHEQTWTGSIGVILQSYNYKDLFEKVGLKALTFKSGPNKDLLNGAREPTEEEKKIVQDLVLDTYDSFLNLVATNRKLDAESLKAVYADGRVLTAKQALEGKLIDHIGEFDDAIKKAKELAGIEDAIVVRLEPEVSLGAFFRALGDAPKQKPAVNLQLLPENIRLEPGKPYYLSHHLFSDQ